MSFEELQKKLASQWKLIRSLNEEEHTIVTVRLPGITLMELSYFLVGIGSGFMRIARQRGINKARQFGRL